MASTFRQRPWTPFQRHIDLEEVIVGQAREVFDIEKVRCGTNRMRQLTFLHNLGLLYLFWPWPPSTAMYFARRYIIRTITPDYDIAVLVAFGLFLFLSPHLSGEIGELFLTIFADVIKASTTAAGVILIGIDRGEFSFASGKWLWLAIMAGALIYVRSINPYRGRAIMIGE